MSLYIRFDEEIKNIKSQLVALEEAFTKVTKDPKLQRLVGTILAVGNCLNAGDKKFGQADGFNIDAIGKASMIQSSSKVTIMQYCCQLCCDEDPDFRSIKTDFHCIKFAVKCFETLKMTDRLLTEIKECKHHFKTITKADPDSYSVFGDKIIKFILKAEVKRVVLNTQFTEVKKQYSKAADWFVFAENDEKRTNIAKFFQYFIEIIDSIERSLPKP